MQYMDDHPLFGGYTGTLNSLHPDGDEWEEWTTSTSKGDSWWDTEKEEFYRRPTRDENLWINIPLDMEGLVQIVQLLQDSDCRATITMPYRFRDVPRVMAENMQHEHEIINWLIARAHCVILHSEDGMSEISAWDAITLAVKFSTENPE